MAKFQGKYPEKGYLIVIDELLSYLTSRDERQIVLDLAFLQSMAEMCSKSRLRVICGVQEKVFDNPRFSFVSETLKKVGDRFTQIIITKEATAYVVSERILKKTPEQKALTQIAAFMYNTYPSDGKYILDQARLIICQSNADSTHIKEVYPTAQVNPLGDWSGGTDVDTGATNRKLGSDMADSVTGGGLHGKDLSKADVSVNIYAWLQAQETGIPVEVCCAIGDEEIDGVPYRDIVETAREYIKSIGGFEKFAEWGLVR